ncbi:MAG: DJ-1/PfpI family protein [Caulobacteraceae bacterium]|nr:DJ-1/PfpI family protein [Caulobacteraceae bacterium]
MIRIVCLLYEGFLLLDAAGPLTTFEMAGQCGCAGYSVEILAARSGLVRSSSGVELQASDFRRSGGCDTLLVPGGFGARRPEAYAGLLGFIRETAADGRRVASVCSGALLLADAGLLHGRRAATHWGEAAELARLHPTVEVDAASLFVRDGDIWTSAGITAGIDLALALIEQDYGAEVARRTAQALVVPFRRPGVQTQHSALLDLVGADNRFNEVLAWARMHLAEPLSVEHLAARAALSVRHFSRAFTATVGMSPAKAIERLRLESARAALEASARSIDQISRESGFNDPDRMRRAFVRTFGEAPQAMRRRARSRRTSTGGDQSSHFEFLKDHATDPVREV